MDAVTAHLNDGPMDDQTMVVRDWIFYVDAANRRQVTAVRGTYEVRRNFAGDPVADSLTAYAFDWRGWES